MGAAADSDEDFRVGDGDMRWGVEEAPEDLLGCGGLETVELLGEMAILRIPVGTAAFSEGARPCITV